MNFRPLDELTKIGIPILIIHGGQDMIIPVESSWFISEEFSRLVKTNLKYLEYAGEGNALNLAAVIKDIALWLNRSA